MMDAISMNRRRFLGVTAFGAAGLAGPLAFLHTKKARANEEVCGTLASSPFGPVSPVADQTTGLPLIQLPQGFSYKSFSWNGDIADDGNQIIRGHDGMAVVQAQVSPGPGGGLTEAILIRNHETFSNGLGGTPIATSGPYYDPKGGGGTVALRFQNGAWVGHHVSIAGTTANCAGGVSPWGTWITCEEEITFASPGQLTQDHGFLYESLPTRTTPTPITAAGRFSHEALVVDPESGTLYLTEDNSSSGLDGTRGASALYRFTPNSPLGGVGSLSAGGTLEALQAIDRETGQPVRDLRAPECHSSYKTRWVPIADPTALPVGGVSGPFLQAWNNGNNGATRFQRLEGTWYDAKKKEIVFCDTEGGPRGMATAGTGDSNNRGEGAVWRYDPKTGSLRNVFVSANRLFADNPDNLTVDPKGNVYLCEDGDGAALKLLGLNPNGTVFEFGRNNIQLTRAQLNAAGKNADAILGVGNNAADFRDREWAGATFDPTGTWLFVNIQDPGITFAITGPWQGA